MVVIVPNSGMKKNAYGNIEDLLIDAIVVTPKGTLNQRLAAPRVSSGPSLQQLVLGSEGTLGIITQVVLKVQLIPEVRCEMLRSTSRTKNCGGVSHNVAQTRGAGGLKSPLRCVLQTKAYGCLVFPTFDIGVAFMRYVALKKLQPASIRLMDKRQTQCGSLFRITPAGMGVCGA